MPQLLLVVFFFSGFAALLYQTIWQRLLTLSTGTDIQSVTIIVAAFMAGLGLGHLAGGHLADRLSGRARIVAFMLCEFAVAAFALASAWLYYDGVYGWLGPRNLSPALTAALVFLVTLWPTWFMGMSLPIAARLVGTRGEGAASWVARLYGWNTAGAACGALCTVLVVFPAMDFRDGLRVGALISVACGLVLLPWWRSLDKTDAAATSGVEPGDGSLPPAGPAAPSGLAMSRWLAVYALSGFIALSLELVWFRILGVAVKSNAFTFGTLLAVYLGGIGLGSLAARHRGLRRLDPVPAFLVLQWAVPLLAALSVTLLVVGVDRLESLRPISEYFGAYSPLPISDVGGRLFLATQVALPVLLIAPTTMLMGLSFGLLQRAVQTDGRAIGRRVGWLQAANIAGALAGAVLTGVVLLDRLGTSATLRSLAATSLVFVWLLAWQGRRWRWAAAAAAVAIAVTAAVPTRLVFWSRLHGGTEHNVIAAEAASGLSVLRLLDDNPVTDVFVNGLGQARLPFYGVHSLLGILPALIHPRPERVAVIGLGSGGTAFGAAGREDTRVVDVIELVAPKVDTLTQLLLRRPYPALIRLFDDDRVRYHFTDGRSFLQRSPERYDIIEADARRPGSAYAGHLYSVEYFELLRRRLRPGGLAVTWTPSPRVLDSLLQVFPYVATFDTVSIGSETPIPFDRRVIDARAGSPFTAQYYAAGGVDVAELFRRFLTADPVFLGPGHDRSSLDVNRDLFPKDEFSLGARGR